MVRGCSLGRLQYEFVCRRCGFCCLHGGQIELTRSEVCAIAEYFECSPDDKSRIPVTEKPDTPGWYTIDLTAPCFFLDKATMECIIQEVKPYWCREYPFRLHELGLCGWFDVIMCPEAREMLDNYFGVIR